VYGRNSKVKVPGWMLVMTPGGVRDARGCKTRYKNIKKKNTSPKLHENRPSIVLPGIVAPFNHAPGIVVITHTSPKLHLQCGTP